MRKMIRIAVGIAAAAGVAHGAMAETATTTFTVTATVAPACSISATNLAFGTYAGSQLDINSTVTANCLTGTTYNIGLNAGQAIGATTGSRKLTSGSNTIPYALYSDVARTVNWGDVVGVDTVAGVGTGLPQNLNVYGRIVGGLTAPGGSYSDTVTATITF